MKLCGKVETIEEIEKTLRGSGHIFLHNGGDRNMVERRKMQGGGFKSALSHRHYLVSFDSLLVDVKLTFDYRDGKGEFTCRDSLVWLLVSKVDGLEKLLGKLTPFYTCEQFYGNRREEASQREEGTDLCYNTLVEELNVPVA